VKFYYFAWLMSAKSAAGFAVAQTLCTD
jgi:predicted outer membrane lipoprotein